MRTVHGRSDGPCVEDCAGELASTGMWAEESMYQVAIDKLIVSACTVLRYPSTLLGWSRCMYD